MPAIRSVIATLKNEEEHQLAHSKSLNKHGMAFDMVALQQYPHPPISRRLYLHPLHQSILH